MFEGKQKPAAIIIVTFVIWMAGQWLGQQFNLSPILALALDFFAVLAFMYALYTLWKLMTK